MMTPAASTSQHDHSLSVTRFDLLICGILLCIGAIQLVFPQKGSTFNSGDTTYLELARSLVRYHWYGFDFRPEAVLPPGFPAMLAVLLVLVGDSHATLIRAVIVFGTFGLLLTYFLLRRAQGTVAASTICLLIATSPGWFNFASTLVFSDVPYLFFSTATLLLVARLDDTQRANRLVAIFVATAGCLVVSLLTRSSGVALVAGMVAWIASSFWFCRDRATTRLRRFGGLVVLGLLVQLAWSAWAKPREVNEWPIGGWPKPYLAQLMIKSGNEPELGASSITDLPARIEQNTADTVAELDYLIFRKGKLEENWFMPWIIGPIVLAIIGLTSSVWRSGGALYDWYFVIYEAMFLVWPWDFEFRFLIPVAPLACLYIWRGCKLVLGWMRSRRRASAAFAGAVAFICCAAAAHSCGAASRSCGVSPAQGYAAIVFWLIVAALAATALFSRGTIFNRTLTSLSTQVGAIALGILVALGAVRQIALARANNTFDVTRHPGYPQVQAALWLREHTPGTAVVMARQLDVVYHYASRRVVWFPPSADAEMLMNGIMKYHVDFVVVVERGDATYWRPGEDRCFERLIDRYPSRFALVQQGTRERVYAVVRPRDPHSS
jgi:hypothetical protein